MDFRGKKRGEVLEILPHREKGEDVDQRKAQDQETGRDRRDLEGPPGKKLDGEKRDDAHQGDGQAVHNYQIQGQLEIWQDVERKVDIQVKDQERDQGAEKQPGEQGIDQDLEELHQGKTIMKPPVSSSTSPNYSQKTSMLTPREL